MEETESGCSTEKLQEKLAQAEADQREALTTMEYQISKAKHKLKIKAFNRFRESQKYGRVSGRPEVAQNSRTHGKGGTGANL